MQHTDEVCLGLGLSNRPAWDAPVGTLSHLTKSLHSFWSLCSGPISKIVPGGRLIWSSQRLLICPRPCNSKYVQTQGCLLRHLPSAGVVGNTEICHTFAVGLSTWQLLHISCPFSSPVTSAYFLQISVWRSWLFLTESWLPRMNGMNPGDEWQQVTLCFITLPPALFLSSLLSLYCLYQHLFWYPPASVR